MNRHRLHRPTPTPCHPTTDRRRRRLRTTRLVLASAVLLLVSAAPEAAHASEPGPMVLAVKSIDQVVDNVRLWLLGILASWATLCLTVAFFRYTSGEAEEVEKGKRGFRSAAIGYAGAVLAPLLVTIVDEWVG